MPHVRTAWGRARGRPGRATASQGFGAGLASQGRVLGQAWSSHSRARQQPATGHDSICGPCLLQAALKAGLECLSQADVGSALQVRWG